jgi:HTH-type transcriptional regulator/antitoxin HigA
MTWTVLKTEPEHQSAMNRLEDIFDSKPGDPEFSEAELLVMLIDKYETENEEAFPDPDPIEVIKFRMEQNNLRNKDLAEILGSKSKASELLSKKRRLTLGMIRKINRALGIPAELLIGEYDLVI